jgi:hypothetical protein
MAATGEKPMAVDNASRGCARTRRLHPEQEAGGNEECPETGSEGVKTSAAKWTHSIA